MRICVAELSDVKKLCIKTKLPMMQSTMANFILNYSAEYWEPYLDPELLKSQQLYHWLQSIWHKGEIKGQRNRKEIKNQLDLKKKFEK